MAMVKDVVCGMEIDSESAAATSEHDGTTYYFCAPACKEQFDANPAKYVSAAAPTEPPALGTPAGGRPWWQFWKR